MLACIAKDEVAYCYLIGVMAGIVDRSSGTKSRLQMAIGDWLRPGRRMHLVFFDESKDGPDYRHYHIGGIGIAEADLAAVERLVNGISEKAFGSVELTRETELHAVDIYHRKGNFKHWADVGERLALLSGFADILSLDLVRLIDIHINCDNLHLGQSAGEIAFMFLCERANDLVKSERSLGMLIGDRENDRLSDRYARTLSNYRVRGTDFAYGRDIDNLVDSVHFSHSHLSRFLQLADVYTWFLQFRNRNQGSKDRQHQAVLDLLARENVDLFPSKYKVWPK